MAKPDPCLCTAAPVAHYHGSMQPTPPTVDSRDAYAHLTEHAYAQPGDCTPTRELRHMLNDALELAWKAENKLARIEQIEVHGREFVDAAELYHILGKPIPEPVDHTAAIKEHHDA